MNSRGIPLSAADFSSASAVRQSSSMYRSGVFGGAVDQHLASRGSVLVGDGIVHVSHNRRNFNLGQPRGFHGRPCQPEYLMPERRKPRHDAVSDESRSSGHENLHTPYDNTTTVS